jgi:threonine dehydrogenase-like Zn-dependent dehydrogenase
MVAVPVNLCARIPDTVSDEAAAFTVIGAIALQGIRLVAPTLGEAVVVTGLGLIGLLTVQLLRAQGCRVLGIDLDPAKLALARQFGAETVDLAAGQDPVAVGRRLLPRARGGCGHHHRRHPQQRTGASGRPDVSPARAHRAGGRGGAGTVAGGLFREGAELSGVLFLRPGAL